MLAALTFQGLEILRHGAVAPLWRSLVTPDNALALNLVSALVVAACVVYAVRCLVFRTRPREARRQAGVQTRLALVFAGLPVFVIPQFADEIANLSPFFFTMTPCALSLALMTSQIEGLEARLRCCNDETVFTLRTLNLLLVLSGACAAVGSWEGVPGIVLSVAVLSLAVLPAVHLERSVSMTMFHWLTGFFVCFLVEGFLLGWPWDAIRMFSLPLLGLSLFVLVSVVPVILVRVLGAQTWLVVLWGLVLVLLAGNLLVQGRCERRGPTETFVRKVLSNLGDRKIIIGDCLTDDMFDVLKPSGVRLVGVQTVADREFLLTGFDERECVTNRALVVRHCYTLPETTAMMAELGVPWTRAALGIVSPTTAPREAMRALVAAHAPSRPMDVASAVAKGIREIREQTNSVPVVLRKARIEETRENIRWGWLSGMQGLELSETILDLDVQLNDWDAAEADALMALLLDRDDAAANAMLGRVRLRKHEYETAEAYLRKGLKGERAETFDALAVILVKTGRAKEAEAWARRAMEKAPSNWHAHETLTQALIVLKEPREAQKALETAERLAKEQGAYAQLREAARLDRAGILRLRARSATDDWGEDASDRWGE